MEWLLPGNLDQNESFLKICSQIILSFKYADSEPPGIRLPKVLSRLSKLIGTEFPFSLCQRSLSVFTPTGVLQEQIELHRYKWVKTVLIVAKLNQKGPYRHIFSFLISLVFFRPLVSSNKIVVFKQNAWKHRKCSYKFQFLITEIRIFHLCLCLFVFVQ